MKSIKRVKTFQVGRKLFIFDGETPLRYVDLVKNTVKVYPRKGTRVYKVIYKLLPKEDHGITTTN